MEDRARQEKVLGLRNQASSLHTMALALYIPSPDIRDHPPPDPLTHCSSPVSGLQPLSNSVDCNADPISAVTFGARPLPFHWDLKLGGHKHLLLLLWTWTWASLLSLPRKLRPRLYPDQNIQFHQRNKWQNQGWKI